jgi:Uma2 family endonuclease
MDMTRPAFRAWVAAQPAGRYERIGGKVVAMAPERWEHARLKAEIWRALDAALVF